MAVERFGRAPFGAHVVLLEVFLAHRDEIVERIQEMLNAQRKPSQYLRDGRLLSRQFEDCFFTLSAVTSEQSHLRGQLEEARRSSGFRPRAMPQLHNDLIDPAEMMIRAFHLWAQTRWPGRNGRVRFAHTLFNLYVIRCLELLSLRLWDDGPGGAGDRLAQVRRVLGRLWTTAPRDQPVLVRDARWLIPLAQSPTTDDLAPYFEVAQRIAETLSDEDRIEIHKASVQTAGGHLRSQLRHTCTEKGVALGDQSVILSSRASNALDFAQLIQGLVPLLHAYEEATQGGDRGRRLELAGAICQGISADPELFVNCIDLLGAYSMIEHLFTTADGEEVLYTPMGRRHVRLLQEYETRIRRLSKPLYDDCPHFRPVAGRYSPYGVIYGFSSNLTEHMALKTLQSDAVTDFALEDVFAEADAGTDKLAWVSGWRKLPHIDQEVQKLFDYPQSFAEEIFERVEHALRRAASDAEANAAPRTGRLFIQSADDSERGSDLSVIPALAALPERYIGSSDPQVVTAHKAHSYEETRLLRDRQEGMFLVSYQTAGGWTAITKDVLTEVLGAGRDVRIEGLPRAAARVLELTCRNLARGDAS